MGFRLVPKSMTWIILRGVFRYFALFYTIWSVRRP